MILIVLTSLERGISEFEGHGGHLLRWIYVHVPTMRRSLRALLGSRLVKFSQCPDILKVVNINPMLRVSCMLQSPMYASALKKLLTTRIKYDVQLLGDIIAGVAPLPKNSNVHNKLCHQQLHLHLLMNVLLPLHSPNQMIEWRDQIPVLQLYHQSLVRCLVRLIEWDRANLENVNLCLPQGDLGGDHSSFLDLKESQPHINTSDPWQVEDVFRDAPPSRPWRLEERPHETGTPKFKEKSILVETVRSLLESYWPEGFNTNTPKEILLLHEVLMLSPEFSVSYLIKYICAFVLTAGKAAGNVFSRRIFCAFKSCFGEFSSINNHPYFVLCNEEIF